MRDGKAPPDPPPETRLRHIQAEAAYLLERVEELGLSLAAACVAIALDGLNSAEVSTGDRGAFCLVLRDGQ